MRHGKHVVGMVGKMLNNSGQPHPLVRYPSRIQGEGLAKAIISFDAVFISS